MLSILLFLTSSVSCPVLNTATARGVLGEDVKANRTDKSGGYTCQFTGTQTDLTIQISTLASPSDFSHFAEMECEGGREQTPLKAIGNEALACTMGDQSHMVEKTVVRVRNKAFVVRLDSSNKMASAKSLRIKTAAVAEQVAGNLF